MAAKTKSPTPHDISQERLGELRSEATRLIDSVSRLKAARLEFDDDPTAFAAGLRRDLDGNRNA